MAFRMDQLVGIGVFIILIGFIIMFIGALGASKDPKSGAKVAVGGFIGPIPFGFGNDKAMVWTVIAISAIAMIIWFIFSYRIG